MRWLFAESTEETRKKVEIEKNIDTWWKIFQKKLPEIESIFSGGTDFGLPDFMNQHLESISQGMMWEFGPAIHTKGHRLVITHEGAFHLHFLVKTILERAPKIPGWEFYEGRLAESIKDVYATVAGRIGEDISNWKVKLERNGKRMDVCFLFPYQKAPESALSSAFIATESLVGEENLNLWIGSMDVAPLSSIHPTETLELAKLPQKIATLIQEVKNELPAKPIFAIPEEQLQWVLFEMKPKPAADYPQFRDMFVGKSCIPGLPESSRSPFFTSTHFSQIGEIFCYLKTDGIDGFTGELFHDKADVEDALDQALRKENCGCFIGGGTGLRYSYVDLALLDLPRSIEIIRNVLQKGHISNRTWLLFYDTYFAAEWIGIYPQTPPPPT